MNQTTETTQGLRVTPRQRWIFALYALATATIAACAPLARRSMGGINVWPIVLLLSPWLLGLLVIAFDRPGALRNWLAPLLLAAFYPIVALWYDVAAVIDWIRLGQHPVWAFAAFLNVVFLGGFLAYVYAMYPRPCPGCSRRALIPLLRLGKQEKRTSKTRWCACCGAQLWKDGGGRWQRERRRTWLDAAEEHAQAPSQILTPHIRDAALAANSDAPVRTGA